MEQPFEQFEINLVGQMLTIKAFDEEYEVWEGTDLLCKIHPVPSDAFGTEWKSIDLVSEEWVKQIGELIEEHDL